jgi:GNAT superfamily N-acetyltransferase
VVRELTPELWPVLADLFDTTGPVGRCWCMYWRIGSGYRDRPAEVNEEAFAEIVANGPPPGLVAFDGDVAVGWCQLTPRASLPALEANRQLRVDDEAVWSISCFYVRTGHRRRGVTAALITAAVEVAQRRGAIVVEAYPLDAAITHSTSHTGYSTTFERAGFSTVARHAPARPIMRRRLDTAD